MGKPDSWALLLETKEEQRKRNLAARDAAKPVSVPFPKTYECGLCDKVKPFLIAVKRFNGKGGVFACSTCVLELLGKEQAV